MKSLLVAVALGCSFTLAHPPPFFPFYGNGTSSSTLNPLISTGVDNCTSTTANFTSVGAVATSDAKSSECACSTSVTTTTIYIFAPDTTSSTFALLKTTSAGEATSTNTNVFFYSIVNGTTSWSNGIAPPNDASTTFYSTTTVTASPTDQSTTEVTSTFTNTRSWTLTAASSSVLRTETVIITETQDITTTLHRFSSMPSFVSETDFTSGSGATGSLSPPISLSKSVSIITSNPPPTSQITMIPASQFLSEAPITTGGNSTSDTLGSGITASNVVSNESDVTILLTSSHTVTESRPSITSASLTKWNGTLGWNTTKAFGTNYTIPTTMPPSATGIMSAWWTITNEAPQSVHSSLSLRGTETSTFMGPETGGKPLDNGTALISNTYLPLSTSHLASIGASYGKVSSTQADTVLTQSTRNMTSTSVFDSTTSSTFITSVSWSAYFHSSFFNATTLASVATQSSSANITSVPTLRTRISANSSGSPVSTTASLFTSSEVIGNNGSNTLVSPELMATTTLSTWTSYQWTSPIASTEGSGIATPSPGNDTSILTAIVSATVSTSILSAFSTPALPWSYGQVPTSSSIEAGAVTTQLIANFSGLVTSGNPYRSSSPSTSAFLAPLGYGQTPPILTSALPNPASVGNATCGEIGNFTVNWDDEPLYVQTSQNDPPFAPVFSPYHHLFFANGFEYYAPNYTVSNPEPYDPVSGPNVAIFHVNGGTTITNWNDRDGNGMLPGSIGAGPRADDSAYWFNAYSAELGCDNGGTSPCNMTITGYSWDKTHSQENLFIAQNAEIQPCNQLEDCKLQYVMLNGFEGLSSIRFEAIVDGTTLKSWIIDNLSLGWYDSSCAAGLERINSKK